MTATVDNAAADLQRANAELQRQLNECRAERDEALERETATAEVLQVINSSPGDLAPVFDAMLDKALQLCGAAFGILHTLDGERIHAAAHRGFSPAFAEFLTGEQHQVAENGLIAGFLRDERLFHHDVAESEAYRSGVPAARALVELVPLHRGFDELIVAGAQGRQRFGIDQHFDASGYAGVASDQPVAFEREHHLVD